MTTVEQPQRRATAVTHEQAERAERAERAEPAEQGEQAEPEDAEIIAWSLSEPERFAPLFHRHAPRIHRYIAQRLSIDAADDLMAETFLIAFRRRRRYDLARRDARPWLYGIATNMIARHRAAEVRKYRLLARTASGTADTGVDVGEAVANRVTAQKLHGPLAGALADLPARVRNVLLLVAWADLSYEEVAQALDIPVGTVRSRLHRARRRLREALGGADPTLVWEDKE